jgi:hypothetical protein
VAIDTAAKRRNTVRIMLMPLYLGLNTDGAIDNDDRENAGRGYIGFDYAAAPAAVTVVVRSRIRQGMGIGF